jgi:hypothetical protein
LDAKELHKGGSAFHALFDLGHARLLSDGAYEENLSLKDKNEHAETLPVSPDALPMQ